MNLFSFLGRAWHKGCFKCTMCHRALDSRIACDGPDNDVYCNGNFSFSSFISFRIRAMILNRGSADPRVPWPSFRGSSEFKKE